MKSGTDAYVRRQEKLGERHFCFAGKKGDLFTPRILDVHHAGCLAPIPLSPPPLLEVYSRPLFQTYVSRHNIVIKRRGITFECREETRGRGGEKWRWNEK